MEELASTPCDICWEARIAKRLVPNININISAVTTSCKFYQPELSVNVRKLGLCSGANLSLVICNIIATIIRCVRGTPEAMLAHQSQGLQIRIKIFISQDPSLIPTILYTVAFLISIFTCSKGWPWKLTADVAGHRNHLIS